MISFIFTLLISTAQANCIDLVVPASFAKKQKRLWTEALEHLNEDLSVMKPESSSNKDRLVRENLLKATQLLPEIEKAWLELKAQDKSGYFQEAYKAVWATLTVHSHEILDARTKDKDYSRYFAILKTITEFDPKKSRFSFYKIRRAVEGRFSIHEYIECR